MAAAVLGRHRQAPGGLRKSRRGPANGNRRAAGIARWVALWRCCGPANDLPCISYLSRALLELGRQLTVAFAIMAITVVGGGQRQATHSGYVLVYHRCNAISDTGGRAGPRGCQEKGSTPNRRRTHIHSLTQPVPSMWRTQRYANRFGGCITKSRLMQATGSPNWFLTLMLPM